MVFVAFRGCLRSERSVTLPTQARSKRRELLYLKAADAYFDDEQHFNAIRFEGRLKGRSALQMINSEKVFRSKLVGMWVLFLVQRDVLFPAPGNCVRRSRPTQETF